MSDEYEQKTTGQKIAFWRLQLGHAIANGHGLDSVIWDIMETERRLGFKAGARHEHETIAKAGE